MDKLKSLLKQLGGGDEFATAICEEFDRYAQSIKEKYKQQYDEKIHKARNVCLEEINKEKALLAKKVGVYLEAKEGHMVKAAEKHRLSEDTEATSTLKRVKAIMEGIEYDDQGHSRELQAAQKQTVRLQKAVQTLKEERDIAVRKANEANGIAVKALKKNRLLESKIKTGQALSESKTTSNKKKGSKPKDKTISEEKKPKRRRLDQSRRAPAKGRSTRETIVENQVKKSGKPQNADKKIAGIAASMDE